MVNISSDSHHNRSSNALLQQAAQLSLGVKLGAEGGHAEVVLGAKRRHALLLEGTAHHGARAAGQGQAHVDTSLHLLGQSPPVCGVQAAGSRQLGGSNPVSGLVLSAVGHHSLGGLAQPGPLPHSLKSEGELRGDRLHVASDEDTCQAALEVGWVERLDGCGEVVSGVLLLPLRHILTTGAYLKLGLGDHGL